MRLKNFASLIGVSPATVSLALNDSPGVAAATKKRVIEAAAQFGYIPNAQGRALRRGRSDMIGCIIPSLRNSFYDVIFCGLSEKCTADGYALLSMHIDNADNCVKKVSMMLEHGVEGMVFLILPGGNEWANLLSQRKLPFILYDAPESMEYASVQSDNLAGGELALSCLLERGHRNILCSSANALRLRGNLNAAAKVQDARIIPFDHAESIPTLLEAHPEVTAITAYSDIEAVKIMRLLQSQGISVPEDISIVGFDDMPFAAWPEFELTTVAQSQKLLGAKLGEQLMQMIAQPGAAPERLLLPPQLVVRNTVKIIG